jgi:hypothetical protein
VQSSVRPGPRCGPMGGRRLKRGLFNRYVIVGISEAFGVAIKKSRVCWHMIILSIIARCRAQSVAVSISRKIREKDATGSRIKRLGYTLHLASCPPSCMPTLAQGSILHDNLSRPACWLLAPCHAGCLRLLIAHLPEFTEVGAKFCKTDRSQRSSTR